MNSPSHITPLIFNAALAITALAALSGCAAVGNPDGGSFDETPPRITSTHPENGATGFSGRKVTIDFNEFIKLENASEKVVVSPPQLEQPEIKVVGKKIQVELFDTLIPNTTYSIDFADGIVDNNEGNPLGDYCFRFSTGDVIDSLEVSGYVLNAEDLEPIKGMTVGLHSDLSDSAFTTKQFERVSRTDMDGHFTIRGIAPGKYRIYAVKDMDGTFSYSQRNEMIAWLDSAIVPTSELRYRQDTVFNDKGVVESTITVPYIQYLPNDLTLLAFTPQPVIQYMSAAERPTHEKFTLCFALPLDSMPKIKGLNFDESDAYILQHSARYDTLNFWIKDTLVYYKDTLTISVDYLATDTAGILSPRTDTLNLVPKKSHERILKEAARKAEDEQKELEKQIRRLERIGDSIGIVRLLAPKTRFLDARLTSGASMSIYANINLSFSEPVTFLSDTAIHLYQKVDTLWKVIPFDIEHDTINILRYNIYAEWKPDQTFRIMIDSASIQGLYGLYNNKIETTLKFNALSQYSTLTVNVNNPQPGYSVRLHNNNGKILRDSTLRGGSVDFFLLSPTTYFVSMYHDRNGNGKWDVGEYEEKRQPESVWYIKKGFTLKQDWTHETEAWNVHELPLFKQKPDELIKEKSKSKKADIHKKNLERLEKKSQQIESERKKKEKKRAERKQRRINNKIKYQNLRARYKKTKTEETDSLTTDVPAPDVQEVETPEP